VEKPFDFSGKEEEESGTYGKKEEAEEEDPASAFM